ncbi:MAG: Phosphoribosylformylglycinamidine synthase subunit PurL [Anaerolineae bacterium]|nr:Phosphoribosylformylglycinamidine synthase subunit PurL [Anaerolineae bacterium]
MQRYARVVIHSAEADPPGVSALRRAAHDAGLAAVSAIHPARLFFLRHPQLTDTHINTLCRRLLADPVVEQFNWQWVEGQPPAADGQVIEVEFRPGVTDREAFEVRQAARRLGFPPVQVATGHHYRIEGQLTGAELHRLARQVLCNEVVQQYRIYQKDEGGRRKDEFQPSSFIPQPSAEATVEQIDLRELDDAALVTLSQQRRLALNRDEMTVLRDFSRQQNRPLTDAEVEMAAQTWSEHCFHKTFKAHILYEELNANQQPVRAEIIDGLLRSTIRAATEACRKPWLVSAFVDNAGIVEFDGENVLSFKVETHNHPSALEPFGGANTGVGGVIRDVVGVSARPIAVTDVLCFGPQTLPAADVPDGSLHPRRVQAGVVAGVGDYGNKMGIPNVNGAVLYHPGYTANPLVFCGCLGLAPAASHVTQPQVGDRIIVLGGHTGRDGLRGATFSSLDLDSDTGEAEFASTAVQIGDPIVEKDVTEVIMLARDERLYHAITDCGAGGLSSAVGEMGSELGAAVELTQVGLKYSGLRPWEIWLSEAQERMVLAVPAENLPRLEHLCRRFDVEWDNIGTITGDGQMVVTYAGAPVVNLPMALLHDGHPRLHLTARWHEPEARPLNPAQLDAIDPAAALLALLADPNVASKEAIIRTYDHEVQGGTVVKPLTGVRNHGPSDAAVIVPNPKSKMPDKTGQALQNPKSVKGVAVSSGINPLYGLVDPYRMALAVVDEAVRNAVAVGADPDTLALLDNFCWGNPNLPDRLGGLVRAAKGCYDAARAFDAPFISGKDSLNNEYVDRDGQRTPIPGTLLISAIGIVPDIQQAVTMDLKAAGNRLYVVGNTRTELGGSLLAQYFPLDTNIAPRLPRNPLRVARQLHAAMRAGLVRACHDCSEGGLVVAAAEMALAGGLGLALDIEAIPADTDAAHPLIRLFSESTSRWLVEVEPEQAAAFEEALHGCVFAAIGQVTAEPRLRAGLVDLPVAQLEQAWQDSAL